MRVNIQTIAKVIISLAALAVLVFALRGVNVAQALGILLSADPAILITVVLVQAVSLFIRLVRWKYQLRPAQEVPLGILVSPLLISYAVGNVTVTGVGAVPRVYLLNRRTGMAAGFIAGTWVQEYVLDATALLSWSVIVPCLVKLPPEFHQVQFMLIVPLILVLLVDFAFWRRKSLSVSLLMHLGLWERIKNLFPGLIGKGLGSFGDGLSAAFAYPLTFAVVVLTTFLIWATEVLIFWLLLLSLDIPFGYLQASVIVVFTHLVIGIPSVPGFVGTLEAATVSLVLALGGTQADALAYAVLLRVFLVGPTTLLGVALAWREGLRLV
ncbi:MAG: flippase-like domain-containing protein [Chloroflexi bacterium]|nr:flippase-like domain-containing protein [Chloroflexota bacterium]